MKKQAKKKTFIVGNQFPVILEEEKDGGYVAAYPSFEGCYSQGDTMDEALQNIKEAILLCLDEVKGKHQKFYFPKIGLHLIGV